MAGRDGFDMFASVLCPFDWEVQAQFFGDVCHASRPMFIGAHAISNPASLMLHVPAHTCLVAAC